MNHADVPGLVLVGIIVINEGWQRMAERHGLPLLPKKLRAALTLIPLVAFFALRTWTNWGVIHW